MANSEREGGAPFTMRLGPEVRDTALRWQAHLQQGAPGVHITLADAVRSLTALGATTAPVRGALSGDPADEGDADAALRCVALERRVAGLEEILRAWQGVATDAERANFALARAREDTRRALEAGRAGDR